MCLVKGGKRGQEHYRPGRAGVQEVPIVSVLPKWLSECLICHKVFKLDDPSKPLPKHKMPGNPNGLDCLGSGQTGVPRGLG